MNSSNAGKRNQKIKKQADELIKPILEELRGITKDKGKKAIRYKNIPKRLTQSAAGPPRRRPPCFVILGQDDGCSEVLLVFVPEPLPEDVHKELESIFKRVEKRLTKCYPTTRLVVFFFPYDWNDRDEQSGARVIYMEEDPTRKWKEKKTPVEVLYYLLTTVDNPVEIKLKFKPRPPRQTELDLDE
jgi:hypothetical protein